LSRIHREIELAAPTDLASRFFLLFVLKLIGEYGNMDIKELTAAMDAFVSSKGWYEPTSKRPQTPRNLSISLSLEVSEILEHFQWCDEAAGKDELAGELADVALYLLQLASLLGIDLEQAVLDKLKINATREWDIK
jgi:NTP pyrophosphatase (non-canonical NTP hydrolase)